MMNKQEQTVTSNDGTSLTYSVMGHGPAIILIDGAFCYREHGPTPKLAPLLASHFTVHAYDRRGRGASGDTHPYDIEREIEDLQAIMDKAGEPAFVFGMSSGAALALRAAKHGLPIKRLALYEPPFVGKDRQALEKEAKEIERLVSEDHLHDAVAYVMNHVFGVPKFFVFVMRLLLRGTWKQNLSTVHTVPYDLAILGDGKVTDEMITPLPALVIGGEKSPEALRNAVDATVEALPNAQTHWLAGQSHNVSMDVLAPVIIDFFKETTEQPNERNTG